MMFVKISIIEKHPHILLQNNGKMFNELLFCQPLEGIRT